MSRSTSLNGINILGEIQSKHIKADPRVHKEYERLRNMSTMNAEIIANISSCFTISLLNIRSLKKHSIDIKHDTNIFDSDIICLTETQLLPDSNVNDIRANLHPFTLFRKDHVFDKYSSLAICSKPNIEVKDHKYFSDINGLKFVIVNHKSPVAISILLLYRKNSFNFTQYVNNIRSVLKNNDVHVILGDFNINYLNDKNIQPLNAFMKFFNFVQTVQNPTFVSSGSLLDHVYVRNEIVNIINTCVIPVYYSDHDAVKISLNFSIS